MKTKYLLLATALLTLCGGCATTAVTPIERLKTDRTYAASTDVIWSNLVAEVSGKFQIQAIEKDSGLITTEYLNLGSGFAGWQQLKLYAYEPKVIFATWAGGARVRFSVLVQETETGSTVRINATFEGFDNNGSKQWHIWQTNGRLENDWLDMLDRLTAKD